MHLSLRVELLETVSVVYAVTCRKRCHSDVDQGQADDHRMLGQARCRSHDDVTLSSAVVTGKA